MKDFETACENSDIKLYVIPPRTPELNGCVERCNRTLRYEFYRIYDGVIALGNVQAALAGYINEYNSFRPHQALNQDTPLAYYQKILKEAA